MLNFIYFLSATIFLLERIQGFRLSSKLQLQSSSQSTSLKTAASIDYQDNTPDDWFMIEDGVISSSSHEPGYPAVKANGIGEWRSKDGSNNYVEVKFKAVSRVHHLNWVWTFPPKQFYVMVTLNGTEFVKTSHAWLYMEEWEKDPNGIKRMQHLYFAHAVWCLAVRIYMDQPHMGIFGLEKIQVFSANAPMIIKTQAKDKKWYCLTNEVGYELKEGKKIVFAEECDKATIASDGRELFNFKKLYMFKSYKERECFTLVGGKITDGTHIEYINCEDLAGIKDRRDIFKMLPDIKPEEYIVVNRRPIKTFFLSMKDTTKCITMLKDPAQLNWLLNATAHATSSSIDGKHEPSFIVDMDPKTYWASNPGEEKVSFYVNFMAVTMKSMKISFRSAPSAFVVNGKTLNGEFKRVATYFNHDPKKTSVVVNLFFGLYCGFEIKMEKFGDSKKPKLESFYSIDEITIDSQYYPVVLMGCDSKEHSNKWLMEEYYFENSKKGIMLYKSKEKYAKTQSELFNNLKTLSDIGPQLGLMKYSQESFEKRLLENRILFGERRTEAKQVDLEVKTNFPLLREPKKNVSLGYIEETPAKDCYEIQEVYKDKRDGFYFIKNECVKQTLRVFCSFAEEEPRTLYYKGGLRSNVDSNIHKTVKALRNECAKDGMRPLNISSPALIQSVEKYLKTLSVKIEKDQAIPLAYDYNCDIQGCKGLYSSLTEEETGLTVFWGSNVNLINPFVGFAFHDFAIDTFDLKKNSSLLYKGVVCSTNSKKDFFSDQYFVIAECSTTALDTRLDVSLFTKVNVKCPGKCHLEGDRKAYGTAIYAEESYICVAGVHAGVIDPYQGGFMVLGFEQGISNYEGKLKNKVYSFDLPTSLRSFVILPFDFGCPSLDSDDSSSFLQIGQFSKTKRKLFRKYREINSVSSFLQLASHSKKKNENFYELENDITILEQVSRVLTKVNKRVLSEIKLIDNPEFKKDLFSEALAVELYKYELNGIKDYINYNMQNIEKEMKKLRESSASQRIEKISYTKKFEDTFYVYDFTNSFNKVEWTIDPNGVLPSFKVVFTQKEEQTDDIASVAELKDRYYYDFSLLCDVEVIEGVSTFGILFRLADQFNYYSYETLYGEYTTTRIVRVERNKRYIVYEEKQTGLQIAIPYHLNITMSGDDILVKAEPVTEGAAPIIKMKTRDEAFNFGSIAFATTSVVFSISGIEIHKLNCKEPEFKVLREDEELPPVACSRFKEELESKMEYSWETYDPENCTDCPSAWSFEKTETIMVLTQQSLARPIEPLKIPTILKLKKPEACNEGLIIMDFIPFVKEGYVGIAFDYSSQYDFSVFEVGGKNCSYTIFKEAGIVQTMDLKDCKFKVGKVHTIILQLSKDIDTKDYAYLLNPEKADKSRKFELVNRQDSFKTGSNPSELAITSRGTRVHVQKFQITPSEDLEDVSMNDIVDELDKVKEIK